MSNIIEVWNFVFALSQVLKDGWRIGAAVLGVPAKATIKEVGIFLLSPDHALLEIESIQFNFHFLCECFTIIENSC